MFTVTGRMSESNIIGYSIAAFRNSHCGCACFLLFQIILFCNKKWMMRLRMHALTEREREREMKVIIFGESHEEVHRNHRPSKLDLKVILNNKRVSSGTPCTQISMTNIYKLFCHRSQYKIQRITNNFSFACIQICNVHRIIHFARLG